MSENILVVCEKNEQAKALKDGLKNHFETKYYDNKHNKTKIPNLYYESEGVTIVAARGHLLTLYDVNDYLQIQDYKSWVQLRDYLPYVPDTFKYKPKSGWERGQLELISNLIHSGKYTVLYNFGDPDAEGELLIREILSYVGNTLPTKRIDCRNLVPSVLSQAFRNPENSNNYNGLYFEALARQQTDWLNGINLTTMLSLATHETLQVGRVLVPIVRFVYDSDKAIENFVPTNSWGINMNVEGISIASKDIQFAEKDEALANNLVDKLNANKTIVTEKKISNKTLKPKKLYNTSKLLSDLNTKFKISMKAASAALEKLYLKAYITYPRTNCEYMQEKEAPQMEVVIGILEKMGLPVKFHTKASVFSDKKCGGLGEGGHTAIVITEKIPSKSDLEEFTDVEKAAYSLVYKRTISNFCEDAEVTETKFIFENSGYVFDIAGSVINKPGFLLFEPRKFTDVSALNKYEIGSTVNCTFEKATRTTKAPPKANTSRLIYYLEHPFSKDIKNGGEDEDDEFYAAVDSGVTIGTQGATMETTTTKAIQYGYFTESKKGYTITSKGKFLIETLDRLGIDALNAKKTVELNMIIKKVSKKLLTLEDNKERIKEELIATNDILNYNEVPTYNGEVIGECPLCKSPVVDTDKLFKCTNTNCKFVLFKEDKYFSYMKKKISTAMVKEFLNKGEISVKNLTSQSGNKYGAVFKGTINEKGYVNWKRDRYIDTKPKGRK